MSIIILIGFLLFVLMIIVGSVIDKRERDERARIKAATKDKRQRDEHARIKTAANGRRR